VTDLRQDNDRAILEGNELGFVKIFVLEGTDQVLRFEFLNSILQGVGRHDCGRRGR
jgi:hypothetical protein